MKARFVALGLSTFAVVCAVACSSTHEGGSDGDVPIGSSASPLSPAAARQTTTSAPSRPNYFAGPADFSRSVVQHGPTVGVAYAHASPALRDLPAAVAFEKDERFEHEPGRNPLVFPVHPEPDAVLQSRTPIVEMPVTLRSFLGQGSTLGGCVFPKPDAGEPSNCTTLGDPPDTVGAVGPNHFVQVVNSGISVWSKSGTLLGSPKYTSSLFVNHPTTDGNACSAPPSSPNGGDWGDGVVLYDQMADRWLITQFDITNGVNNGTGPSYQCVAVSQTSDPTGAYWTYDFQYSNAINDYGKFSVWPDAYYASFNLFDASFTSADLCAYDRVSMLKGATATQQCFANSNFGFLPASVDGAIKPPVGEPGFFVALDPGGAAIDLYKLKVDWVTTANSTFSGPTALPVSAFNQLCAGGDCIAQPSPGNPLASLGDRPMFHLSYRNYGTVESLVVNHSVSAGSTGGVRWYEIQSPNGTPVVQQQGTYAPSDGKYRWMGSLAQDQAQDIALGFSIASSTTSPSIAWTGHLPADGNGVMGQGEAVIQAGAGVEMGTFSDGTTAARWGDYSNMTVDPTDDCTFWYTQEAYPSNGTFNWDTHISSVTFPRCAQNDFTIGVGPSGQNLGQTQSVTYTVTTSKTKGTAESIALVVQDLPTGVTAGFAPATVTAGGTSTLTLSATSTTAITAAADVFTVIGKAPSAVHAATGAVTVTACQKITSCASGENCGTISDGCGGQVACGTCRALDACHVVGSCTANACSNPIATNGTACPSGTCQGGVCVAANTDAGSPHDAGGIEDAGGARDAASDAASASDAAGAQDSGQVTTPDSGGATPDSGALADAAAPGEDAAAPGPSEDASAPNGNDDGGNDGGGATSGTGSSSGCGCRTAPAQGSPLGLAAIGAPVAIAVVRRRTRKARRQA